MLPPGQTSGVASVTIQRRFNSTESYRKSEKKIPSSTQDLMFRLLFVRFGHFVCGFWQDNLRLVTSLALCLQNRIYTYKSWFGFKTNWHESPRVNLHPFLSLVSGILQVWSSECILTSLDSDQLKKYPPLLASKYQVSTTKKYLDCDSSPVLFNE